MKRTTYLAGLAGLLLTAVLTVWLHGQLDRGEVGPAMHGGVSEVGASDG